MLKLTPLQVLAMYSAFRPTIEFEDGRRDMMLGFFSGNGSSALLFCKAGSETVGVPSWPIPVLKPFADLVKPLPDGTVPAVEAAKQTICLPAIDPYKPDWSTATASIRGGAPLREVHIHWLYRAPNGSVNGGLALEDDLNGCLIINEDWSAYEMTEDGKEPVDPALYDRLRSLHFAVGLESDQYVIGKEVGNG